MLLGGGLRSLSAFLVVTNVVGLIVIWIISVINVCLGPRRRWKLALNYVNR